MQHHTPCAPRWVLIASRQNLIDGWLTFHSNLDNPITSDNNLCFAHGSISMGTADKMELDLRSVFFERRWLEMRLQHGTTWILHKESTFDWHVCLSMTGSAPLLNRPNLVTHWRTSYGPIPCLWYQFIANFISVYYFSLLPMLLQPKFFASPFSGNHRFQSPRIR